MNVNKILILEDEFIGALDINNILTRNGSYLPVIINSKENILSSIIRECPELIIMSTNIYRNISHEILAYRKEFNTKLILLSAMSQYNSDQIAHTGFNVQVISKPFSNDILLDKVQHLLKAPVPEMH